MKQHESSKGTDSTTIVSLKQYFRSSRFHWSILSKTSLSEQDTNEINSNVKGFFEILRKWKQQRAESEQ